MRDPRGPAPTRLLAWTQVHTTEVGGSPGEPRATSDPLSLPPAQTRSQTGQGGVLPTILVLRGGSEDANPKGSHQGARLAPHLPARGPLRSSPTRPSATGGGPPASKTCTLNDKGQRPGHRKPSSQLRAAAGDSVEPRPAGKHILQMISFRARPGERKDLLKEKQRSPGSLPAREAGRVAVNTSRRGGPSEEGCRAGGDTRATARGTG